MRWLVRLEGSRLDVERLLAQPLQDLVATEDPTIAQLEVVDPDHSEYGDEAGGVARAVIQTKVRHINGFGNLRWGRSFGGVEIKGTSYENADGGLGQVVFA